MVKTRSPQIARDECPLGSGDFQSSRYYMDEYPDWVRDWNGARPAERLAGQQWELLLEAHRYRHRDRDDRPYEVALQVYLIGTIVPASRPISQCG